MSKAVVDNVIVKHAAQLHILGDYEAAVPLIEETREIIQSLDDSRPCDVWLPETSTTRPSH